jgi:hypothetical protein
VVLKILGDITVVCDLYVCGGRSMDRNLDVDISNYVTLCLKYVMVLNYVFITMCIYVFHY